MQKNWLVEVVLLNRCQYVIICYTVRSVWGPMARDVDSLVIAMQSVLVPGFFTHERDIGPVCFNQEVHHELLGTLWGIFVISYCRPVCSVYRKQFEPPYEIQLPFIKDTSITRKALKEHRHLPRLLINPVWHLMSYECIMIYFKTYTFIPLFDIDPNTPTIYRLFLVSIANYPENFIKIRL